MLLHVNMELCDESLGALLNYWIGQRNYARDCRWTQKQCFVNQPTKAAVWEPRIKAWDLRYKFCATMVREIKKLLKELEGV